MTQPVEYNKYLFDTTTCGIHLVPLEGTTEDEEQFPTESEVLSYTSEAMRDIGHQALKLKDELFVVRHYTFLPPEHRALPNACAFHALSTIVACIVAFRDTPCEWVHVYVCAGWGLRERGLDISKAPNGNTKKELLVAWVNWYQSVISPEWDAAPQHLLEQLPARLKAAPIRWEVGADQPMDDEPSEDYSFQLLPRRNFAIDKSGWMVPEVVPLPSPLENASERLQKLQQRNAVGKCNACCKRVVIAERNQEGGIAMTAAHTGPYFHRPDCQLFTAKEFEASDASESLAVTGLLTMQVCVCLQHWPHYFANVVWLPRKTTLMPA